MGSWDESKGREVMTQAERSQLAKEQAVFAAKKEKARPWASRLMLAKAQELGAGLDTLLLCRTVWRAVFKELEKMHFDPATGESAQAKALCMFAPIEFVDGG